MVNRMGLLSEPQKKKYAGQGKIFQIVLLIFLITIFIFIYFTSNGRPGAAQIIGISVLAAILIALGVFIDIRYKTAARKGVVKVAKGTARYKMSGGRYPVKLLLIREIDRAFPWPLSENLLNPDTVYLFYYLDETGDIVSIEEA